MLYGQTVRIPAGFAWCVVATHGFVAWENVFEGARENMMNARLAISSRRTLIETETRTVFGLLQCLVEHLLCTPKLQHLLFKCRSVITTLYFFKSQNAHSKTTKPRIRDSCRMCTGLVQIRQLSLIRGECETIAVPPGFAAASRLPPRGSIRSCTLIVGNPATSTRH